MICVATTEGSLVLLVAVAATTKPTVKASVAMSHHGDEVDGYMQKAYQ